jgi:hypothetical protein
MRLLTYITQVLCVSFLCTTAIAMIAAGFAQGFYPDTLDPLLIIALSSLNGMAITGVLSIIFDACCYE